MSTRMPLSISANRNFICSRARGSFSVVLVPEVRSLSYWYSKFPSMMERILMNMIFDENKIVTAVTLSRYQAIPIDEAYSAMKQFYEKHSKSNGLWATFSVTGSTTTCGVCVNSTILYRGRDLDKIKDTFNEVLTLELFSLQIIEIEDLRKLMSIVRLQDQNLVRLNDAMAPVYSSEVSLMARNLRDEIERANSDFLLAMKNVLDKNENSYLNGKTRVDKKENRCLEEAEMEVKDSLLNNESVISQGSSPDSLEQPLSPIDNLSQSSAFSESSGDSKPSQQVLSTSDHEEVSIQPKSEGEKSAVDGEQLVPRKRKSMSKLDEAPARKRQAERSVETYRDEDGFLVTKEVIQMVESDEPKNRTQSQPLSSVSFNKVRLPAPTKKNSSRMSNTPKISTFFSKK